MAEINSIKLSDNDRAFYIGVSTLSKYGASLDNMRRCLRKVKKDIDGDGNLDALTEAKEHLDKAINSLETWHQLRQREEGDVSG